jgi:hypothetical protein
MAIQQQGITRSGSVGIRATEYELFDLHTHDFPSDANQGPGDWLVFYTTNPWGLPQTRPLPALEEPDDEDWVRRSDAALRDWMENNPF